MHSTPPDAVSSLRRLSEHVPIDLGLATEGYLTGPKPGSIRYIHRLDDIARYTQIMGASLHWDVEMTNPVGWCLAPYRYIALAGFAFWEEPEYIRHLIAHETCHLLPPGRSEAWTVKATETIFGATVRQLAVL